MRIRLVTVGMRRARWEREGFDEYARRMPAACTLDLVEVAAVRRGRGVDVTRAIAEEGDRLAAATPANALIVALDERGEGWSTRDLASRLGGWIATGRDVALLVGGADGLDPRLRGRADLEWSLSPLTLPHGLVRVVVAEQIYRAWSLLNHHPYHRD